MQMTDERTEAERRRHRDWYGSCQLCRATLLPTVTALPDNGKLFGLECPNPECDGTKLFLD